jgi:hypothetical protein
MADRTIQDKIIIHIPIQLVYKIFWFIIFCMCIGGLYYGYIELTDFY